VSDDTAARITTAHENNSDEKVSLTLVSQTPVIDSSLFSPEPPRIPEHTGVLPLHVSGFDGYDLGRPSFLRGAELLGLSRNRRVILPQQYVIADAINAINERGLALHKITAVCIPRRASKTSSVWAVALGRLTDPDLPEYQVGFTAQTGVKARERFLKDVVAPLERLYPDPATRPFTINRAAGSSHIVWPDGSRLSILPPTPESFRGDAYDMVIIDEAQTIEAGPETDELYGAILPTFLTRPGAQLILLGTAGAHRSGMLWEALVDGRDGNGGIVEYALPDTTPLHSKDDPEGTDETGTTADRSLWHLAHPIIGTLAETDDLETDFKKQPAVQFAQEFLGIWPQGVGSSFINKAKWDSLGLDGDLPALPRRFALAFQAHHEQTFGAVAVAWRDEDGRAVVGVLDHKKGTAWMADVVSVVSAKYKTPVVWDSGHTPSDSISEQFLRHRPPPEANPQNWNQVSNAAALFTREIETGNLRHYRDATLDAQVPLVTKRGTPYSKKWAFGRNLRLDEAADITAVEAAALALYAYDNLPEETTFAIYV
jgi:hypothetical protein